MLELSQIVQHFSDSIKSADAKAPQAINVRSKKAFQPGIGPHTEAQTVAMVAEELQTQWPGCYAAKISLGVPYPEIPRQKCDFCVGHADQWDWAIEVKMLRLLGDNGKLNDNMLMHILSPYPAHRSALTDCQKLRASSLARLKAILIYGYDHPDWPLATAIEAFERLAKGTASLGPRQSAEFTGLVHPVHKAGGVFAWQLPTSGETA